MGRFKTLEERQNRIMKKKAAKKELRIKAIQAAKAVKPVTVEEKCLSQDSQD